jgi:hypothetical protein
MNETGQQGMDGERRRNRRRKEDNDFAIMGTNQLLHCMMIC